jgi:hypothetical protein
MGAFTILMALNIIGALLSLLVMCLAATIGTFGYWLATKNIWGLQPAVALVCAQSIGG